MIKLIISILLIIFFGTSCTYNSSKKEIKPEVKNEIKKQEVNSISCIKCKLKVLTNKSYHDTILEFRIHDSSLLVVCDTNQINSKLENLLLESKYIPSPKLKGYYSFIACLKSINKKKEIGFFYVKVKTSEAWEVRRFEVENYKITGINVLPNINDGYITPKECDEDLMNVRP